MKISLAMGFFDSVHLGHRQLLTSNREYAAKHGLTAAAHTFCSDVSSFFGSSQLYDYSYRRELLVSAGAELIIAQEFDRNLMNMSGKDFLDGLTARYDVGAFFCGFDYTFGKNAQCDARYLAEYAKNKNIKCEVIQPQLKDGRKISTTWIKELLLSGDIEGANVLLGDPYCMRGKVIHGRGEGAKNGFPTANLDYNGFVPKHGVYKTVVSFDGEQYLAVTNVGPKPTFLEQSVSIEPMLIDFDGDLYGKEITVQFVKYIRPTVKFTDGEELNRQIQKDVKEALC